ncbi:alpha/beta hydrolase [Pedobacter polaris]|uniref:Alpha/beta hydrolase n=1 Tax=Pedobacter polaris TaxID=2571273 RepID=A0A4U1CKE6_9SPHI|nr:alpha/beta hydrolase [Pedobacter polaris]TKC06659.1 alpha/beta hydrolase [Pedobacter polaris]
MKHLFILWLLIFSSQINYAQDQIIPLYEKTIPNSKKTPLNYVEETDSNGLTRNVSIPTMAAYFPAKNIANGTAVIIFAGGGYFVLAQTTCVEIAKAFNKAGVTAFVLKYRLPNDVIMIDKSIGPLQDAQRAIQLVRERAIEWNINPAKIGMVGLSAGGHLVSTEGTQLDRIVIDNKANISLRPNFMVLLYPVIIYDPAIPRTRENLIGKTPDAKALYLYGTENHVSSNTPPTFLVHALDDDVIPVKNSLLFFNALLKAKVKAEMHIVQDGGHGFGLYDPENKDKWFTWCIDWMKKNGFY